MKASRISFIDSAIKFLLDYIQYVCECACVGVCVNMYVCVVISGIQIDDR